MHKWALTCFAAVGAVAEAVQLVALLWTTLHLTGNASMVGVVNAFAYLPGVIAGVALRRAFDRGSAITTLSRTNWVCVAFALALAASVVAEVPVPALITLFCASQGTLSIAKLANKSALARALRLIIGREDLPAVQGRISSTTIIGGVIGSGLSGILLAFVGATWCFVTASALYAASVLLIRSLGRGDRADETHDGGPARIVRPGAPQGGVPSSIPAVSAAGAQGPPQPRDGGRMLALVLLVSIPSSGALQFLTALLPSYADAVVPGSAPFYSALDISAMLGGVLAGAFLGLSARVRRMVQRYALVSAGLLCLLLVPPWPGAMSVLLVGLAALVITAHVVGMQIATNQLAPDGQIGRYMAVRNAGAGLAKAVFSVAAGVLAQLGGVPSAWLVLSCFLLAVAAALSLSPGWRRFAAA
ncbi:MFS transporter [Arthrobacter sp.]|uniref:MFS transporter n=1 Tax=Arthrobacter sp. TaxID=1667 RepID=UPI0025884590|nr:MFS transporter [Arthrobacter sp.]